MRTGPTILGRAIRRCVNASRELFGTPSKNIIPRDVDDAFVEMLKQHPAVGAFSPKLYTTYKATEYVVKRGLEGDLIECGVHYGRQVMIMAATLMKLGDDSREIYLYDTFAGMTRPSEHDFKRGDTYEANITKWEALQDEGFNRYSYAALETVRQNVLSTGYPEERLHFVQGDVMETVPGQNHQRIAILRLDTDWYELTLHELNHLYPLLVDEGVLIIDDYGSWEGARKAVDEYFSDAAPLPLLIRTDISERVVMK